MGKPTSAVVRMMMMRRDSAVRAMTSPIKRRALAPLPSKEKAARWIARNVAAVKDIQI